jgi:hypothetical protein
VESFGHDQLAAVLFLLIGARKSYKARAATIVFCVRLEKLREQPATSDLRI